ncbi:hypothetical protein CK203_113439 [Vitis vinifera]|uniref:MAGE domain-containing protein n=1 Tax=Vitis vinifera TaxID=29760 RepID=A0A438BPD5_VITVI|nr:hypothetical protein CK203_113439 [Vitis vinifera]
MLDSFADVKSYVIISQLPADVYRKYVEDVNTAHLTGFTFVIVSIVYLAGGKIAEAWMCMWLEPESVLESGPSAQTYYRCGESIADGPLASYEADGLYENEENHPVLGNISRIGSTCPAKVLQKDKVNGPEGNTLFYELAERALDEAIGKKI